ncbi:unnamed protein product [Allacma fusca]|uniref:Protein quiver n=1 Tax=Allacma fusca TaxID=39272 RepID=A0A8J2JN33_9HEXA|nr:unnamed protein product [Allacma fusca]
MNRLVIISIVIFLADLATGLSRRCYSCRSRGIKGDCRDPFRYNETFTSTSGISITPCPSGWCSKFIEGIHGPPDEYGTATERACIALPPTDGEERCAKIDRNNKPTLVCFCQGDLCNEAQAVSSLACSTLHSSLTLAPVSEIIWFQSTRLPAIQRFNSRHMSGTRNNRKWFQNLHEI